MFSLRNKNTILVLCAALAIALYYIIFNSGSKGCDIQEPQAHQNTPDHQNTPEPQNTQEKQVTFSPEPQTVETMVQTESDTSVTSGNPALVRFFSENCPHARAMAPEWKKAEPELRKMGVEAISMDEENYAKEIMDAGIVGYPTVRFYPEGFPGENFVEYRGSRKAPSFIKFVKSGGVEA